MPNIGLGEEIEQWTRKTGLVNRGQIYFMKERKRTKFTEHILSASYIKYMSNP